MTRLIVQLVCLLVAALVLSDGKKWNTTDPVVKYFCEVDDLKGVALKLLYLGINISDSCTCKLHNASAIKEMMGHFNKTCKTFTAVNAFKYQLQHYLFHDANNESLEVVRNITSIIIGLQAAAKFLQDIMINNGTTCVKFSPQQYKSLYECIYEPLDTSDQKTVLTSLVNAAKNWLNIEYSITMINNKDARILNSNDCK